MFSENENFEDSGSEIEADPSNEEFSKQLAFIVQLEKFPVLLEKSQVPAVKEQKKKAITSLMKSLGTSQGVILTDKQVYKKINNLKTLVKTKTDKNKTENRKISLSEGEKRLLKVMQSDDNPNPVLARVPGAISIGSKRASPNLETVLETIRLTPPAIAGGSRAANFLIPHTTISEAIRTATSLHTPPKIKKTSDALQSSFESEETRKLSTVQLQRLVLLKQMKLIDLKIKKQVSSESNNSEEEELLSV